MKRWVLVGVLILMEALVLQLPGAWAPLAAVVLALLLLPLVMQ